MRPLLRFYRLRVPLPLQGKGHKAMKDATGAHAPNAYAAHPDDRYVGQSRPYGG